MPSIVVETNTTAQWHQLVMEAQSAADVALDEELESYLVFLLMRYIRRSEIASSILALDYLEGVQSLGKVRIHRLRDVGDQCLLYSGLFPQRARRRRVRISYFVDLGRSAYISLADNLKVSHANLYINLAQWFVPVMDVMHAMRRLGGKRSNQGPDLLSAMELWQDTGSKGGYQLLKDSTQGEPIKSPVREETLPIHKKDLH